MNRYAELCGNTKKPRIKSLDGNKLNTQRASGLDKWFTPQGTRKTLSFGLNFPGGEPTNNGGGIRAMENLFAGSKHADRLSGKVSESAAKWLGATGK